MDMSGTSGWGQPLGQDQSGQLQIFHDAGLNKPNSVDLNKYVQEQCKRLQEQHQQLRSQCQQCYEYHQGQYHDQQSWNLSVEQRFQEISGAVQRSMSNTKVMETLFQELQNVVIKQSGDIQQLVTEVTRLRGYALTGTPHYQAAPVSTFSPTAPVFVPQTAPQIFTPQAPVPEVVVPQTYSPPVYTAPVFIPQTAPQMFTPQTPVPEVVIPQTYNPPVYTAPVYAPAVTAPPIQAHIIDDGWNSAPFYAPASSNYKKASVSPFPDPTNPLSGAAPLPPDPPANDLSEVAPLSFGKTDAPSKPCSVGSGRINVLSSTGLLLSGGSLSNPSCATLPPSPPSSFTLPQLLSGPVNVLSATGPLSDDGPPDNSSPEIPQKSSPADRKGKEYSLSSTSPLPSGGPPNALSNAPALGSGRWKKRGKENALSSAPPLSDDVPLPSDSLGSLSAAAPLSNSPQAPPMIYAFDIPAPKGNNTPSRRNRSADSSNWCTDFRAERDTGSTYSTDEEWHTWTPVW